MSALPQADNSYTEAEYLAFEQESDEKHEFIDGEIFAMSGASPNHNLIVASTIAAMYSQIRGSGCKIYPSDMKVRTPNTATYTYPDITIVCGDAQFVDEKRNILSNPTVIIEVLSESTELYDRGEKFRRYRELPSLKEYILIAQNAPVVDHFFKRDNDWHFIDAVGLDASVHLQAVDCTLNLTDVYEQVDFTTPEE